MVMIVAPVVVIAIPIAAVLIGDLIAPLKASTEVIPRTARHMRTSKIPVAARIWRHPVIQIVMPRLKSRVESLALKIVELLRRLLPAQLEADLRLRHRHRQRTDGYTHG
jgi:hypothetical protein